MALYIDNGDTGKPELELLKQAFSDTTPVTLTFEKDGQTWTLNAYMTDLIISKDIPIELRVSLVGVGAPIITKPYEIP